MNKKGGLQNQIIIHIILVGLIFAVFLYATAGKINARGLSQEAAEKQMALLIDSARPGMSFTILKKTPYGSVIQDIKISNGNIFVTLDNLNSHKGYPFFSKYKVSVKDEADSFTVEVK